MVQDLVYACEGGGSIWHLKVMTYVSKLKDVVGGKKVHTHIYMIFVLFDYYFYFNMLCIRVVFEIINFIKYNVKEVSSN